MRKISNTLGAKSPFLGRKLARPISGIPAKFDVSVSFISISIQIKVAN